MPKNLIKIYQTLTLLYAVENIILLQIHFKCLTLIEMKLKTQKFRF